MKKMVMTIALVVISFGFVSCSSGLETTNGEVGIEMTNDGKKENEEAVGLSCKDLKAQYDEFFGKEVLVSAFSWGNNEIMGGEVQVNLGDEKLDGMQQASVVVIFSEKEAERASVIQKDSTVRLKAIVGAKENGAIQLLNPEVMN